MVLQDFASVANHTEVSVAASGEATSCVGINEVKVPLCHCHGLQTAHVFTHKSHIHHPYLHSFILRVFHFDRYVTCSVFFITLSDDPFWFIFLLSRLPEDSPSEMCSPASTEENIGLFMLRKDSERRATLHRVLTDYISLVVFNIQESVPQVGEEKMSQLRVLCNLITAHLPS